MLGIGLGMIRKMRTKKIFGFPDGIPAGGRDLRSSSKAAKFGGKKGTLWPIKETIHPSEIMKPGEQGTKE